ncbi:MAG TPA: hypothetical protein VEQ63_09790, partial [Bryobacteraceae bacterium]|nr:hypothetical protein [Bryobacteraceae bacterium]
NLAADRAGNIYISEFGANRILKVAATGGLTVVAGTGKPGYTGDGGPAEQSTLSGPAGLAIDASGALYVADSGNRRIRRIINGRISTLQDGAGAGFEFITPTSIGLDSAGTLYVADGTSVVTTISASGRLGTLQVPARSLALHPFGTLLVTRGSQITREEQASSSVVAGSGLGGFAGDNRPAVEWRFNGPAGMAKDAAGTLYIADSGNGRVRRISAEGELSTLLSGLQQPLALTFDVDGRLYIAESAQIRLFNQGGHRTYSYGSTGRPFKNPSALLATPEGIYVADTGNHLIRRVAVDGSTIVIAGGGGNDLDQNPLRARLASPAGLALDADGNLWFSEAGAGRIRMLDRAGKLSVFSGPQLKEPRGITIDKLGNVVVCDAADRRVLQIARDGSWTALAGSGDQGVAESETDSIKANLSSPMDVLLGSDGSLLFSDLASNRIYSLKPEIPKPEPPPAQGTLPPVTVHHAATGLQSTVAPDQLVYLRGENLVDEGHLLPAETEVLFGGKAGAVLKITRSEILVQVPPTLEPGLIEVSVVHRGKERAKGPAEIASVAPGLFAESQGKGQLLASNEDGTRNSAQAPCARGSILVLYGTGARPGSEFSVQVGSYYAEVLWSGAAPGSPGLFQINVRTPSGFAPSGKQPVVVTADGVAAQDGLTIVTQ